MKKRFRKVTDPQPYDWNFLDVLIGVILTHHFGIIKALILFSILYFIVKYMEAKVYFEEIK